MMQLKEKTAELSESFMYRVLNSDIYCIPTRIYSFCIDSGVRARRIFSKI